MDPASLPSRLFENLSAVPARSHSDKTTRSALASFWRHRIAVFCCIAAALGLSIVALKTLEKSYSSEVLVQLDLTGRGDAQSADAALQTETRIIQSRAVLARVVDRLGLVDQVKPSWNPCSIVPASLKGLKLLGCALPTLEPPVVTVGESKAETAIRRLIASLTVEAESRSYLIAVHAVANQPKHAAEIANAIATEYIELRIRYNVEAANRKSIGLTDEIQKLTAQLADAERAVAAQRATAGVVDSRTGEAQTDQQMRSLVNQLSNTTLSRINEESRLVSLDGLQPTGPSLSPPSLQDQPMLQHLVQQEISSRKDIADLTSRLGDRHPSVINAQAGLAELRRAISNEAARARAVSEVNVQDARRTEQILSDRISALRQQALAGASGETEYNKRFAAAQAIRDRIASLTQTLQQVRFARDVPDVGASIVVRAEPVWKATSPKPLIILLFGLVSGLGFGCIIALLLDERDQGLFTEAEVQTHTGHRLLGMLPDLAVGERPTPAFDEAARSIGASAGLFGDNRKCQVILVTSSAMHDGASVMCEALARALMLTGRTVLKVDATAGLCDGPVYSGGDDGFVINNGTVFGRPGLDRMQGISIGDPHTLDFDVFGSNGLAGRLEQARSTYNAILIEAPPALQFADALVLGRMADRLILAARWGKTQRSIVRSAIDKLHENNIVVDGIALTCAKIRRKHRASFSRRRIPAEHKTPVHDRPVRPALQAARDASRVL